MSTHIKQKILSGFLLFSLLGVFALGYLFYTLQNTPTTGHEVYLFRTAFSLMAALILAGLVIGRRLSRTLAVEVQRSTQQLQQQVLPALEAGHNATDHLRVSATRLAAASYETRRRQETLPASQTANLTQQAEAANALADQTKLLALNLSLAVKRKADISALAKTAQEISKQTASLSQNIQAHSPNTGDNNIDDIHQTVEKVTRAAQDMLHQAETISQHTQRARDNVARLSKK